MEKILKIKKAPRILIAPLDWGLGHATRCIPIINVLIEEGLEVVIAAEGHVATLLQQEFPALVILPLKGYRVRYNRENGFFLLKMLLQFPLVMYTIIYERIWIKKVVSRFKIDAVISDNRFGLYVNKTLCVYVTHQLFIQTGNRFLNKIAQKIHFHFINKFNACWIPDAAGLNNLAGKLSHPESLPACPVQYLGILSRCKKILTEKKTDLLILLSGPEPQRSIFENNLLKQINNITGSIVLVRGLPDNENILLAENKQLTIHNHLTADALNELIQQSVNIITRSGYSTIMDLVTVQQKAILVPTPGQTEQEYLATYLMEKKIFISFPQENFSIQKSLEAVEHFNFAELSNIPGLSKQVITDWLKTWRKQFNALQ